MALEEELQFFDDHKAELLQHYERQFALIKGARLVGTYTTFEQAFEAGVRTFGNVPFLIKQVKEHEDPVQYPALSVGMLSARS